MRRPLYSHSVIQVGPLRMMPLGLAFLGHGIHKAPSAVESLEKKLAPEALFRRRELPRRKQRCNAGGQVCRLVCGEGNGRE